MRSRPLLAVLALMVTTAVVPVEVAAGGPRPGLSFGACPEDLAGRFPALT